VLAITENAAEGILCKEHGAHVFLDARVEGDRVGFALLEQG